MDNDSNRGFFAMFTMSDGQHISCDKQEIAPMIGGIEDCCSMETLMKKHSILMLTLMFETAIAKVIYSKGVMYKCTDITDIITDDAMRAMRSNDISEITFFNFA